MLEIITFSLLNGVVYGLLLFMVSSGLTLIFSLMGVLNFAHASMFMLGAYFSYQIGMWIGFWPALVFAPLLVGAIGAAVERYGLRHVHKQGHVAEILFTFGLAYLVGYRLYRTGGFAWPPIRSLATRLLITAVPLGIAIAEYATLNYWMTGSALHPPYVYGGAGFSSPHSLRRC